MATQVTKTVTLEAAKAYEVIDTQSPDGERQFTVLEAASFSLTENQCGLRLSQLTGDPVTMEAKRVATAVTGNGEAASGGVTPLTPGDNPVPVAAGRYQFSRCSKPGVVAERDLRAGQIYHLIVTKPGARPIIAETPATLSAHTAQLRCIGPSPDVASRYSIRGTTNGHDRGFHISVTGVVPMRVLEPGTYDICLEISDVKAARIDTALRLREIALRLRDYLQEDAAVAEARTKGAALLPAGDELANHLVWLDGLRDRPSTTMQRLVQAWSELRHDEFFDLSPAAPSGIAPSGDMASRRPRLRAQCDQLLFYIGYMTMPQQVKDWLPGINVGEYIDFHARFSDDLPSAPHRTRILEWMVAGDTRLDESVFDVTSGLIYKTKPPGWPQLWDMFWVIVSLLFFSFLVMFVIKLDNDNGAERGWLHLPAGFIFHKDSGVWQNDETLLRAQLPWAEFTMVPFTYLPHLDWMPAANLPDDGLFWGWLLVLGGMLLHWLVTFSKGQRQPRPPRFSTARVLPHVSAHKVRIIARFGLAIIAWVVASFAISSRTGNDLSATDYLGFLLAGYAVDSVTDLLSPYLDRQAGDLQTGTQSMPGVPDDGAPSTTSGR